MHLDSKEDGFVRMNTQLSDTTGNLGSTLGGETDSDDLGGGEDDSTIKRRCAVDRSVFA